MGICQYWEMDDKFWYLGLYPTNCIEYPVKKRNYGFYTCDNCHKEFMVRVRFDKMLISKITGIDSIYPFEKLIKTNKDIVDFGISCLMQGVYGVGKTRSAQLVNLMKESGYDLKYTGKRTDEGLMFLLRQSNKHRHGVRKRTYKEIKSGIRFKNHLEQIGL